MYTLAIVKKARKSIRLSSPEERAVRIASSGVELQSGLARDAHHIAILSGLSGHLDPELFEACAADLLREIYSSLTPVRGGSDHGYDGAIASESEPPFPLIATTGKDAKANLLRNLERASARGNKPTRAVFATSRRITPVARDTLEAAARQVGVGWLQIHDQDWFANALYGSPAWAKKLLNVSGRPSALSIVPLSARPLAGEILIGRQAELAAIRDAKADSLLVGAPGSGKTFLLRALTRERKALFLADPDREALANAIRSQRPPAIIVDDAHIEPRVVSNLRQLRRDLEADFRIIAASWPADASQVQTQLDIPSSAVVDLPDIDLDTMVEIVKAAGVRGPNAFIQAIVHQANGRPGLAATLAQLCLRGDAKDVWSGKSLAKDLLPTLSKLAGEDVAPLLACFALGGGGGMPLDEVGSYLRKPLDRISSALARVGTAGILRPNRSGKMISVWPEVFRWLLVRDVFFCDVGALNHAPLLAYASDFAEAAMTLLGAHSRGAHVPMLLEIVAKANSTRVWGAYASLGTREGRIVVDAYPDIALKIPTELLTTCSEKILPLLLDAAVGDRRELHSSPDHPLRRIQDWAQSPSSETGDRVERARNLVAAIRPWWEAHGLDKESVGNVAIHAFCLALDPNWQEAETDPGQGRTLTLSHGAISDEETGALFNLWRDHRHLLTFGVHAAWKHVFSLVHEWHYGVPNVRLPASLNEARVNAGRQILQDLAENTRGQPGIQHQTRAVAHRLGYHVHSEADAEFDILFPFRESPEKWREEHAEWLRNAKGLAPSWLQAGPETGAKRIASMEREAQAAGITWPRLTNALFEVIAETALDPDYWLNSLLQAHAPGDLMRPFLKRMATSFHHSIDAALRQCLDSSSYVHLGVEAILTTPSMPAALVTMALQKAEAFPNVVEVWCLRNELPFENLERALTSEIGAVSLAAAIGEWNSAKFEKRSVRMPVVWRAAIVRSAHASKSTLSDLRDHSLGDIFKADPAIASDWLIELNTITRERFDYSIHKLTKKALVALGPAQRISLLGKIDRKSSLANRIRALVGDDSGVYAALLARHDLREFHLVPLEGTPSPEWRAKAIAALDAGYPKGDVLQATRLSSWSWTGNMSDMWTERKQKFDAFLADPDPRIVAIACEGSEEIARRIADCLKEEREEAVHGRQRRLR